MSAPAANRPASGVFSPARAQIPQRTLRTDRWWLSPLRVDLGFAAFVIYATVRAFQQDNFFVAEVPLPDAVLLAVRQQGVRRGQRLLAADPASIVSWLPYAALSLPFLLLFRLTCYYYRGAYYRSVWQSPTACAVAEPHANYTGETRLPADHPEHPPLLLLHRRHHLADQHLRRDRRLPFRRADPADSVSAWAT